MTVILSCCGMSFLLFGYEFVSNSLTRACMICAESIVLSQGLFGGILSYELISLWDDLSETDSLPCS